MNHEILVARNRLPSTKGEPLFRARDLGIPESVLTDDSPAREALLLSLTFERWPDLIPATQPIPPVRRFYNAYFWFRRFTFLWQELHEPDAGLEQQAFNKLAEAPVDFDWAVVDELEHMARTSR